jgi:hypothetical protein
MTRIKEISFFILIGIIVTSIAYAIDSSLIFTYLQENIISLLLTLLAINTATSGLIASIIHNILNEFPKLDFSDTLKEMRRSLVEQIFFIIIAFVALLIMDSKVIEFEFKVEICNTILVSVFAFSVYALWDTGRSVFLIIDGIKNLRR